jgi:hypothetical protein
VAFSGAPKAKGEWSDIHEGMLTLGLSRANAATARHLMEVSAIHNGRRVEDLRWHVIPSGTDMAVWFIGRLDKTNKMHLGPTAFNGPRALRRLAKQRSITSPAETNPSCTSQEASQVRPAPD